ncbi:1706_t:CDS:1 [Scutellospora calospora]|uniref:1706_t:CDS:1 n=1 Tax=Scutellospora calospora TaxID=85575 RepID=A0ACA9LLH4_9GLOM|nr:1706_t:CDS:1 [Scutellospora calospora]
MSKDPIIASLLLDIGKLAKLFAVFSTEILHSKKYRMINLRPYKLSGINTSVLNAGIFSRAGNQVRLSQIVEQLNFLIDTSFIKEYNRRIEKDEDEIFNNFINYNAINIFNIMINSIVTNLTPFGGNNMTFEMTQLDGSISFIQLIYRNLGGDDMIKQSAFDQFDPATLPSLIEMHTNTIKFKVRDSRELIFNYKNGTLLITKLYIHPYWIETLWNLVMLEVRSNCELIVGTVTCFYTGAIKNKEDFYLAY